MKTKDIKELSKYFLFGLIILLLFLSYKIVEPFIISIVSAFILSFFSKPLFDKLNERMNSSLSAVLCIFLVVLIILVPLVGLVGGVSSQALEIASQVDEFVSQIESFDSLSFLDEIGVDLKNVLEDSSLFIGSLFSSAISAIPKLLLSLVILIFGMYYFLVNWRSIVKNLKKYIPLKSKSKIVNEMSDITTEIVHGFFIIAVLEFLVVALGFYVSGVGPYLVFGVIVFFLAFVPGLGAALVWIPMALYYIITGDVWTFVGVLLTGVIATLIIELFLRAKFIGSRAKINPFVMIIGILGGIGFLGILGFIIGPLILNYSIKLADRLAEDIRKYH